MNSSNPHDFQTISRASCNESKANLPNGCKVLFSYLLRRSTSQNQTKLRSFQIPQTKLFLSPLAPNCRGLQQTLFQYLRTHNPIMPVMGELATAKDRDLPHEHQDDSTDLHVQENPSPDTGPTDQQLSRNASIETSSSRPLDSFETMHERPKGYRFDNSHSNKFDKSTFIEPHEDTQDELLPEEVPTDEELHTLRRVADKIPWKVYTIAFVELCERFSYYGTTIVCKSFTSPQFAAPKISKSQTSFNNLSLPAPEPVLVSKMANLVLWD